MSLRRSRLQPGLAAGLGVLARSGRPGAARAQAQSSFDWRNYPGAAGLAAAGIAAPAGIANLPAGNYMTPVRDQADVGSCWAFAAIGVLEAKYDIVTGTRNSTLDLSEQNLILRRPPRALYAELSKYGMVRRCRKWRRRGPGPRLRR